MFLIAKIDPNSLKAQRNENYICRRQKDREEIVHLYIYKINICICCHGICGIMWPIDRRMTNRTSTKIKKNII